MIPFDTTFEVLSMRKPLRSLLSLLLAVLLLTSGLCTTAIAAGSSGSSLPYTDVSPGDWFYETVQKAYRMELMDGVTATTFQPQGTLTRALFVDVLYRLSGEDAHAPQYSDVKVTDQYADAIGWAQNAGIASGSGDGRFHPNGTLTRQEFFVMIDNFLQYASCTFPDSPTAVKSFSDQNEVASWAKDAIERLRKAGLVSGSDGKVMPTRNTTRVEAAVLAVLMAEKGVSPLIGGYRLPQFSLYTDQPDFLSTDRMAEKIKALAGTSLPAAGKLAPKTIVFTVDGSLRMLECGVREKDGVLTLAVYSKFALPYMERILEDLFFQNGLQIPAGYSGTIAYQIDDVSDLPINAKLSLAGETNNNPVTYSTGDNVTFRVSALYENRIVSIPSFSYSYRTDEGVTKSGTASGKGGQMVVTLPGCAKPGTAMLTVSPQGLSDPDLDFVGTVAFDFAKIKPARSAPSDFKQFWDNQFSKLMASSPSEVEYEKCEDHSQKYYKTYDATVTSPWGNVYLHITVPDNAKSHSLQIKLRCQAYGYRSAVPEYRDDAITVSVNPHSIENDRSSSYYAEKEDELDCWVDDKDTRENCYFLGMIMRDIQALRYVQDKFSNLWDGKTIDVAGASMGGYQALAVGAVYSKVTSLSLSWPWMCDLGGGPAGRNDGWAPSWSSAGQYFDACYFAPYVKGTVRSLTVGLGDYISPPSGIIAMYNALSVQKQATFIQDGRHVSEVDTSSGSFTVTGTPTSADANPITISDNGCAAPTSAGAKPASGDPLASLQQVTVCRRTTARPYDTSNVLVNPGKGFVFTGYMDTAKYSQDFLDVISIGYNRFAWSRVEPKEGQYDWDVIDDYIGQYQELGKQFAFGVMCVNTSTDDKYTTPKWVFEAGAKGKEVEADGHTVMVPKWTDKVFLEKLNNFIKALAERYDGDPRIAFIDIRSYGNWGEQHTYKIDRAYDDITPDQLKEWYLRPYINAFHDTQLVTPYGGSEYDEVYEWAIEHDVAIRRDGIVSYSDGTEGQMVYGKLPAIFEYPSSYMDNARKTKNWQYDKVQEVVEVGAPSYLQIYSDMYNSNKTFYNQIANQIGYYLRLESGSFPNSLSDGDDCAVQLTFRNEGVAPPYFDFKIKVGLLDSNYDLVKSHTLYGISVDWMPGSDIRIDGSVSFTQPKKDEDSYILAIGLFANDEDDNPDIQLGSSNGTEDNWYVLGKVSFH